ncbi:MAG: alpha/beta fold hydrolase [Gemmatimonadetes bacterium]|nr:alpha/beta fold hydrolase [Gemmatimonadota bacterium]
MSTVPPIDLTVCPGDCDAQGRISESAFVRLFEQARWEQIARGPGMDLFARHGSRPVLRQANLEFRAPVGVGDRLRFETTLTHYGRTSFSLHQIARKEGAGVVADADVVLVCVTPAGEPTEVPREIQEFFGRRPSVRASDTQHLAVRGLALALDVQGDGQPVLFVHGFPLDRTMWRQVMATLTGWRRIAPDLRGLGVSDVPESYFMAEYADDLAALLDALHIQRAVVCGLSMGGYVAFELVRRHPDRVRALILANTRADPDDEAGKRRRGDMIALVEREGPAALADVLLPQLLAPANLAAMPHVAQHLRAMIAGSPVKGVVGALRAMRDRADATPLLGEIRVPALVIAGPEDRLIPPAASRKLADAIAGAQLTLIPDAGHLCPLEQPVATSRVIAEFLEGID